MSAFGRLFARRGGNAMVEETLTRTSAIGRLVDMDNHDTWTIAPISNGFLLSRRTYNPQGPDKIAAHYAANPADLAELVTTQMTLLRLNR